MEPWKSLKGNTYHPSLLEWRSEVQRRSKINIATKRGSKPSKNPRCQKWLDLYPILDYSDTVFLCFEIQVRLDIVAKAMEQKKSEEQKLRASNVGNKWYGNDPILRLIHTLDETEIHCAYTNWHDLSNERVVLDNAKSVEKRE